MLKQTFLQIQQVKVNETCKTLQFWQINQSRNIKQQVVSLINNKIKNKLEHKFNWY